MLGVAHGSTAKRKMFFTTRSSQFSTVRRIRVSWRPLQTFACMQNDINPPPVPGTVALDVLIPKPEYVRRPCGHCRVRFLNATGGVHFPPEAPGV